MKRATALLSLLLRDSFLILAVLTELLFLHKLVALHLDFLPIADLTNTTAAVRLISRCCRCRSPSSCLCPRLRK